MKTPYWIVQHIPDVFRNEPRNIGVIVSNGDSTRAKFFGEDENGQLDGRKLKSLPYPEVYRQWVSYWRRELLNDFEDMEKFTIGNYRLMRSGEVEDIGSDNLDEVLEYLYTVLVSDGAITEALQPREVTETTSLYLELEVAKHFTELNILDQNVEIPLAHPILRNAPVQGTAVTHHPAFSQRNGRLYVMETADLTSIKRKQSRDHAGFVAYMFRDIKEISSNTERFSIVRVTEEDLSIEEVKYSMNSLRNESEVINWLKENERTNFLQECQRMSYCQIWCLRTSGSVLL